MYKRCNRHRRFGVSVAIFITLSVRHYSRLLHAGLFSFSLPVGINNVVELCLRVQDTGVVSVSVGLLGCV